MGPPLQVQSRSLAFGRGPPLQGQKLRFGQGPPLQGDFVRRVVARPAPTRGRGTSMYRSDEIPLQRRPSRRGVFRFGGHCLRPVGAGIDEATDIQLAKDAMVRGSGASRPWMACARLLEPGTAQPGDAHDPRTAAAPPEADKSRCFEAKLPRPPPKATNLGALTLTRQGRCRSHSPGFTRVRNSRPTLGSQLNTVALGAVRVAAEHMRARANQAGADSVTPCPPSACDLPLFHVEQAVLQRPLL